MIIKGNRHGNGGKLAAYLMDGGKHGERVAEPELHGFAAENLTGALRDMQNLGDALGIEYPLFHIQIRLPKGDQLTPEQWDITTARTLKTAGLEGQPYARVFHTDEKTGELHCHIAASLIDEQTLTAKPLPFYKLRFKALARKLEEEFDLTRVKNYRDGSIKYGATKAEEQQAQRLGFDKEAVRNTIRHCWDASDCGRTFDAALAEAGLILATGDRGHGNYLVIDPKGGLHVLGKRILGASAAEVRQRLSDLDRDNMPTVEQARTFMLDLPRDRVEKLTREAEQVAKEIDSTLTSQEEVDRFLAAELFHFSQHDPARFENFRQQAQKIPGVAVAFETLVEQQRHREKQPSTLESGLRQVDELIAAELYERWKRYPNHYAPHWQQAQAIPGIAAELEKIMADDAARAYATRDRARDEIAWQDALAKAAIEKEKVERKFVERPAPAGPAQEKEARAGSREKAWPIHPPQPQHQSPGVFAQAAQEAIRDVRTEELHGPAAKLFEAWRRSDLDKVIAAAVKGQSVSFRPPGKEAFAASLDEHGISLARATKEEADRSHRQAAFARELGNYAPRFKQGEIVLITEPGLEYRRHGEIKTPRRVHKIDQSLADKFVKALDIGDSLQGIDASLQASDKRAQQRAADREAIREIYAGTGDHRRRAIAAEKSIRNAVATTKDAIRTSGAALGKAVGVASSLGKTLDVIGGIVESLAAPPATPERKHAADKAKLTRHAEAEEQIEFSRYGVVDAHQRQNAQNEQASRDREREHERGR